MSLSMSLLIWVGLSTKNSLTETLNRLVPQHFQPPRFRDGDESAEQLVVPDGRRIRPVLSAERCRGNQELYSAPGIASFPGWKSISSVHP